MNTTICSEELCTGCAACFNVCPRGSIEMVPDVEGFLRPKVDPASCDDCGACQHVCPILHLRETDPAANPQVYACWNKDEAVRFQSASGGAFSAFAETVLDGGGVVFGAAFDENMRLNHISVNRKEDLWKLRSSKYVQSNIGSSYLELRNLLRSKRTVLFSGTPCQVAGLRSFLGKYQENLLTCDILCKGVPSASLFAKYVNYIEHKYGAKLININFRHKRVRWQINSTVASFSDSREHVLIGCDDSFMFGFSHGFTMRSCCYQCPFKSIYRYGDITLGDFWGIGETVPFHSSIRNGISLILVNSEKGNSLLHMSMDLLNIEERTIQEATRRQSVLKESIISLKRRDCFYEDYQNMPYKSLVRLHLIDKGLRNFIKYLLPPTLLFYLNRYKDKILS